MVKEAGASADSREGKIWRMQASWSDRIFTVAFGGIAIDLIWIMQQLFRRKHSSDRFKPYEVSLVCSETGIAR